MAAVFRMGLLWQRVRYRSASDKSMSLHVANLICARRKRARSSANDSSSTSCGIVNKWCQVAVRSRRSDRLPPLIKNSRHALLAVASAPDGIGPPRMAAKLAEVLVEVTMFGL